MPDDGAAETCSITG